MRQTNFYERLKEARRRAGQTESAELERLVHETVTSLLSEETDARRPGMLLGKIQSGKTRAFLGIIAAAFDRDFDVAVVLTKGTKTLARQTVRRLSKEFQVFRDAEQLAVYDIMSVPTLSDWEIEEQRLVIVAKKEANNMRRLLNLFHETALKNKRVLIVDDEADLASLRFSKNRTTKEIEQGRIADRIDELRRELVKPAILQVTATPYSLYLQPEEYESNPGSNFTFEPKRPAFTKLVPIHAGYIGGDQYFGEFDQDASEFYLWHSVEPDELLTLKKEDRRRVREGQALTSERVAALRHALLTFVSAACIRRLQNFDKDLSPKRYSMIIHVETARSAHSWQHELADEIINDLARGVRARDPIVDDLINQSIVDLQRSVLAERLVMPPLDRLTADIRGAFSKGAVVTEKVNSDNEVEALLDDDAELKLRTPFNVFIGGQILDRGITVPNLIGFYYGRSPKRMQQDTVLQHARMYGNRPREDLAVTRFYTTAQNYVSLKRIHEFDAALRYAFESNAHEREVAFIHRDLSRKIVPCAPSKIVLSDIVALTPGQGYRPFGFQTKSIREADESVSKIDEMLTAVNDSVAPLQIRIQDAIQLIDLVQDTLSFEDGYSFDWEAFRGAFEYYSNIAAPTAERGLCWLLIERGRTIRRIRPGGRFSNAPETYQDRQRVRDIRGRLPILMLLRQEGLEDDGWKNAPFWWPIFFAPTDASPSIFASSTRQDSTDYDEESESDSEPEVSDGISEVPNITTDDSVRIISAPPVLPDVKNDEPEKLEKPREQPNSPGVFFPRVSPYD